MNILKKIESLILENDIENAYEEIIKNEGKYKNNQEYWNLKGIICLKIQEFKLAINYFNKAISIYDKDGNVYYNLGYCYEMLGALSEAALYYGMCIRYTDDMELKEELDKKYFQSELLDVYNMASNSLNKTFIILSSCGWGDVYQRMHHIARSLAKFGNDVRYICPANMINIENEISILAGVEWSIENVKNVDNVSIYQPIIASYNNMILWNNYTNVVQSLLDITSQKNDVVIITYMPYQIDTINKLQGEYYHIYECVDDHSDLEYAYWESKSASVNEQYLMDSANSITTTAVSLYLQRTSIENRQNVYLSKNGINEMDFIDNEDNEIPEDLKHIPEPRIVYSGAVYNWFDDELFYNIVNSNPDKSFIILGFGDMNILKYKPKNLYILGPKKHSELKQYLKHMQVGIIPFKQNIDIIINCDPIKHYEYLGCKIPVVTTFMPECVDKPYTYVCNNVDDFNISVNKCISQNIDFYKIQEFIAINSWNKKAALLYKLSEKTDLYKENKSDKIKINNTIKCIKNIYDNSLTKTLEWMYLKLINDKTYINLLNEVSNTENLKYINKIYLRYLIENKYNLCEEEILRVPHIENIYKAEIAYLNKHNKINEKKFIINMICKNYKFYENDCELTSNYEDIIFRYEILGNSINIDYIISLFNKDITMFESPLINKIASEILRQYGEINLSECYYFYSISLTDKYLNRRDRAKVHKSLFNIPVTECPMCKNNRFESIFERPDTIQIIECKDCGLAFTEKFPDSKNIKNIYDQDYYDSDIRGYRVAYKALDKESMFLSRMEWINNTINNFKKDRKILDVGCATGEFLEVSNKFNWISFGVEISEYGYTECKNKNLQVFNGTLDDIDIESRRFECITMWDVLEHTVNPLKELKKAYDLLEDYGKLYISVPNHLQYKIIGKNCLGYNSSYEHLLYFEPDTIINMLKIIGFKIEQCFSASESDLFYIREVGSHIYVCARK